MTTFIISLAALVAGYLLYGRVVQRVMGADASRPMPCDTMRDDVDYTPMPTWRVFLIQFLNIAGTGPILGAVAGILFGPAAYLWIVLGCIFAGGVHDYMSGMMSVRSGGRSLPEIIGDNLGNTVRIVMRVLSLMLLILVGTVFVKTPADLIVVQLGNLGVCQELLLSSLFWCALIFIYYLLATLLPIGTLIGRIYPLFGAALLLMAGGLLFGIFNYDGAMPEITDAFANHHPVAGKMLFPMLFVTIACGAISGFHGTQSPMMSRCLDNERHGRVVFYGAMITEGVVALIWATAAIKWADGSYESLASAGTPAQIINYICSDWMGGIGAALAVLGVVAAPITSGDTALRSARLIVADMLGIRQDTIFRRLLLAAPIFGVCVVLIFVPFDVLWRYFGWVNQSFGAITLWAITVYLWRMRRPYIITLLPALFMTAVCTCFIIVCPTSEGGFGLSQTSGVAVGVALSVLCLGAFIYKASKTKKQISK